MGYKCGIILTAVITWLSLTTLFRDNPIEIDVPFYDKWVHFLMYAVLSFAFQIDCYLDVRRTGKPWSSGKRIILFLLLPGVWGLLMELAQEYLTTWRSGDPLDALANIVGALLGYVLYEFGCITNDYTNI